MAARGAIRWAAVLAFVSVAACSGWHRVQPFADREADAGSPRYAPPRIRFEVSCEGCSVSYRIGTEISGSRSVHDSWNQRFTPRVPDPGYAEMTIVRDEARGQLRARIIVNGEVGDSVVEDADPIGGFGRGAIQLRAEIPYGR